MTNKAKIELTCEQYSQIKHLFFDLKFGESIIAQVFPDGIVMKILDADTALRVNEALGSNIGKQYCRTLQEREFIAKDENNEN